MEIEDSTCREHKAQKSGIEESMSLEPRCHIYDFRKRDMKPLAPFCCDESMGYPASASTCRRRLTNIKTPAAMTRMSVTKVIQKPTAQKRTVSSSCSPHERCEHTRACRDDRALHVTANDYPDVEVQGDLNGEGDQDHQSGKTAKQRCEEVDCVSGG